MKFVQEFEVEQPVEQLWALFDQPEIVAECMPGMESIETLNPEIFVVRVRQSVGPISATFESRVHITERVEQQRIAFSATGKAVRGAIGNFRAESVVRLEAREGGTLVRVESEAALAGVLGSVGQKVIARQAEKITQEFAANLQARLSGNPRNDFVAAPMRSNGAAAPHAVARQVSPATPAEIAMPAIVAGGGQSDAWVKIAVALGAVNVAIGLAILVALK